MYNAGLNYWGWESGCSPEFYLWFYMPTDLSSENTYLSTLASTFEITLPVILLVVLGVVLRQRGIINEAFIATASKLVFTVSLPVLMFMAIVTADMRASEHSPLVLFAVAAGVGVWAVAQLVAWFLRVPLSQRGAFIQSAFRSNLGIVGLALCLNADPVAGAVLGALILAVVTPVYNLLSVWVLASGSSELNWTKQILETLKNPLIIAILLAAMVRSVGIELPDVALTTGKTLAAMTLPLALISIGGALNLTLVAVADRLTMIAVSLKLVVLPTTVTVVAVSLGFRGSELLIIALMFASPTAAAAFVMAKAMGGDERLTANVIALSTLLSALSVTTIIYVLSLSGLV